VNLKLNHIIRLFW